MMTSLRFLARSSTREGKRWGSICLARYPSHSTIFKLFLHQRRKPSIHLGAAIGIMHDFSFSLSCSRKEMQRRQKVGEGEANYWMDLGVRVYIYKLIYAVGVSYCMQSRQDGLTTERLQLKKAGLFPITP